MTFKKIFKAGLISVSILSLTAVAGFSAGPELIRPINSIESIREVAPMPIYEEQEQWPNYLSFTGTVKQITDHHSIAGARFVAAEDKEGREANILILDDTYIIDSSQVQAGSEITAFYDANAPMIMIYPPQYKAEVVAIDVQDNIKVEFFDEKLVSVDNTLKLNISEETEIILEDGTPFTGDLAHKKLIVIYGASTRSIPAQTTPSKVIVLAEPEAIGFFSFTSATSLAVTEIIVNDRHIIEAPAAYTNEEGIVMVPLRAISEALGYEVKWDGELKAITVGQDIFLKIGEDSYTSQNNTAIKLGTAPS